MNKIIAAVSNCQTLDEALKTNVDTIFYLTPNVNTLKDIVLSTHNANKKIFVHMDMTEGIAKDRFGIEYVKDLGVDGIISTRSNIIKMAKKYDLSTVQRFFVIDAHSIDTTVETINNTLPDMVEIMPGIAVKVIDKMKTLTTLPIIAGGLIETEEEVNIAIDTGASAVSTSNKLLWLNNVGS